MFPAPFFVDKAIKPLCGKNGLKEASMDEVNYATNWLISNKDMFIKFYNQLDSVEDAVTLTKESLAKSSDTTSNIFPNDAIIDYVLKNNMNQPDGLSSASEDDVAFVVNWLNDYKDEFMEVYNKTNDIGLAMQAIADAEENKAVNAEISMMESTQRNTKAIMEFNQRLNGLKYAYPEENDIVKLLQDKFNKTMITISEQNKQALRQFPMQFAQRVSIGGGEWTTLLHMWADFMVEDLLAIDPLVLTAKDSRDNSVLKNLVIAALGQGKCSDEINYPFIKTMLDKNMNYVALQLPGDESTRFEGNAWQEKDLYGLTPMDYLIDYAQGTGKYSGNPGDEQLAAMLMDFANSPDQIPVDNTKQAANFNEDAAREEVIDDMEEVKHTNETDPSKIANNTDSSQAQSKEQGYVVLKPITPSAISESISILTGIGKFLL